MCYGVFLPDVPDLITSARSLPVSESVYGLVKLVGSASSSPMIGRGLVELRVASVTTVSGR